VCKIADAKGGERRQRMDRERNEERRGKSGEQTREGD
jgi:hypothetical protein